METKFLVDQIRQTIKSSVSPCYENTAKTELYVRCPHCGDSKKSKSSAHLYIQMKPPFKFYCQKCGYSGVLSQELLDQLQVYNSSVVDNINEANKTIKKDTSVRRIRYNKINYEEKETSQSVESLNYFNKRFGVNETLESLKKFKIVCDPIQFFEYYFNKTNFQVSYNPRFDYYHALGFLSSDNKYLICRDTSGNQELRYTNVSLSNDDRSKIYNIKTKIDYLCDKVTLVITEGIFDAIGIYYKEYSDKENVIVAAACGKSFLQVIEYFMKMGFLNLDIKIYSDADVDISFYKTVKQKSKFVKNQQLEVYYNTLGKDCGVFKDKISLKKFLV